LGPKTQPGQQKPPSSFLSKIKDALAAEENAHSPYEGKKDPSFVIHPQRESYFGSFGARKSQEGFNFGIRDSIDQSSTLNVPKGAAGAHKFSICNAIFSSMNQNNKSSKNSNKQQDASPVSISPDKDDTPQGSGDSNEKKIEDQAQSSLKTPG